MRYNTDSRFQYKTWHLFRSVFFFHFSISNDGTLLKIIASNSIVLIFIIYRLIADVIYVISKNDLRMLILLFREEMSNPRTHYRIDNDKLNRLYQFKYFLSKIIAPMAPWCTLIYVCGFENNVPPL